jgi:hypothetical protein
MFLGVMLCLAFKRFLDIIGCAVCTGIKVAEIESVKAVFAGLDK